MFLDDYNNPKPIRSLHVGTKTLGVVVKNFKDTNKDHVIGVYIPRYMFGISIKQGATEESLDVDTSKLANSINTSIGSTSLTSRNWVELLVAQGHNLMTPRFARGENVWIETCDEDIKNMYILPYGFGEINRRRDDRWRLFVPNQGEFGQDDDLEITHDNSFGLEINTIDKLFGLWTSYTDGEEGKGPEKGIYSFIIDAKNGTVTLSDTGKRTVEINTDEDRITCMNEKKSKFEMIKKVINIYAEDTINITCDDTINVTSPKLNRKHDDIKTKAKTDLEEIKQIEGKGDTLKTTFPKTTINSSSYLNSTGSWTADTPQGTFTNALKSNTFNTSMITTGIIVTGLCVHGGCTC